jgi:hypothetical protein
MKLLFCKSCQDIVRMMAEPRECKCGAVGGRYLDDLDAVYYGDDAIPMGASNPTMVKMARAWPKIEHPTFFAIADDCDTFFKVEKDDKVEKDEVVA